MEYQQRWHVLVDTVGRDDHLSDVRSRRYLEHDVAHEIFDHGTQASRAGAAVQRFFGDRAQRFLVEGKANTLEFEHLPVLLDQRVFRLLEDPHQSIFVQIAQVDRDWETPHEFGDETELLEIRGFDERQELVSFLPTRFLTETDTPPAEAGLDDLFQAVESASANEEDVAGVELDVLLLRVFSAALGWNRGHRSL